MGREVKQFLGPAQAGYYAAVSWKRETDEIAARQERAAQHGGEEAVATHHAKGRGTIRERIQGLVDAESFREQGPIAGHSELDEAGNLVSFEAANYVLGMGRIDTRLCVVGGEDFTQRGGSPSPAGLRKSVYAEELALRYKAPLVRFLEGGGGSVAGPGQKRRPDGGAAVNAPPRFRSIGEVMAQVPVVSAALGPTAGFPAARLVASHYAIMTRDTAQVLVGGPALVERALRERATKEELGGWKVHAANGVVDAVAADEKEAMTLIRRFLSFLPSHVDALPPTQPCDDPRDRREEGLLSIIPRDRRKIYDARVLVDAVVDRGSFFEMTARYGRSQITGLARLAGQPVGVLANDTRFYAGSMTAGGAQKVRRFVDFCDTFHLPIVSFVDEPGFMIGAAAERAGTIRYGAQALMAVQQSTVPWVSVIVRKSYGVAAAAHYGPEGHVLAWPSAEMGALPVEGGVAVAYRREIESAEDPEAHRAELEARLASRTSAFPRAEAFGFHDLIDPRDTRPALCDWIDWVTPLLDAHRGVRAYTYRP